MTDMLSEAAAELAAIDDPMDRATSAQLAFRQIEQVGQELRDIRDLALHELRYDKRLSLREIERQFRERGAAISKSTVAGVTS